jgi:hypothetical protein
VLIIDWRALLALLCVNSATSCAFTISPDPALPGLQYDISPPLTVGLTMNPSTGIVFTLATITGTLPQTTYTISGASDLLPLSGLSLALNSLWYLFL